MRRKRKRAKWSLVFLGFLAGGAFVTYIWFVRGISPTETGKGFYLRIRRTERLGITLQRLEAKHVVTNASPVRIYAWLKRYPNRVASGTYELNAGMTADQILTSLFSPVHQKFRFPETNWARRNANLLQRAGISSAADYMSEVHDPTAFQSDVTFSLPPNTLEGYLYPDTYDLPPDTGAKDVVDEQLHTFEEKVVKKLGPVAASNTIIRKASLIELETGTDRDRALIAGVIENRLKKGMPLQIDAGIEYALGKWRRLYFKDYKDVKSPYNLYLHKGLPPTPICSPSLKSIEAALHPAKHDYLYYVAMPDGHSIYATTPAQHEHNIRLRKLALASLAKERDELAPFLNTENGNADLRKKKS